MVHHDEHERPMAESLTPREEEILQCLGDGMSNSQIAEHLTVSINTVKWYVRQIYNKLDVANRGEAVSYAQKFGLLPAIVPEGPTRHNLPLATTPFVGRRIELAALAGLIADPQVSIITITGPGGIGKTRLALEVAGKELAAAEIIGDRHQEPPFADGIYFVPLAPIDSVECIVTTLAAKLGFHFEGSSQIPRTETQQLIDYLKHKQMLLLIDNFEQILEGRSLLAEIGQQAVGIKLLVTSREQLQLRGEQLFPLHGLEMPDAEDVDEDSLAGYAAAQLFMNISRRVRPDFKLLQGEAGQLMRICRLVEGMPLGLELAASWVTVLPLSIIADEIEQNLHLLTADHYDLPKRHRSLLATLDTSWKRLTPEQKLILQKLTVFRGGFTRTAAYAVAGATLPVLVTLLNKSWLSYDRQRDRYNIHLLLQQYGAGRLSAVPAEEQAIRDTHCAHFCGYLKEREADIFSRRQQEVITEVRGEIENIQSAWYWAANQGDVIQLSQGLNILCHFYLWEGRMKDGQFACLLAGDSLSRSLAEQHANDPRHLALWSQVLAWMTEFVDEIAQKEKLLAQSQGVLDSVTPAGLDTTSEQAFILLEKAEAAGFTDNEKAVRFGRLALTLFRQVGHKGREAQVLDLLGAQTMFQGAYDKANDLLRKSMEIRLKLDDQQGIAGTTLHLAMVARHQGNFKEAETLHRKSLRLYQQMGNRFLESQCLGVYAITLNLMGNFTTARETVVQAIIMKETLGRFSDPFDQIVLARVNLNLGHYTEAKAVSLEVLATVRQHGLFMHTGFALMILGSIAFVEGDLGTAKGYLLESTHVLAEYQHIYQALPQAILSYVIRELGDRSLALEYLESALRFGVENGSIAPLLYCLPVAALLAADDDQSIRAIELHTLGQQNGRIANSRWFDDVSGRQLESLLDTLPPEIASAAQSRGQELELWATAEQLLLELSGT